MDAIFDRCFCALLAWPGADGRRRLLGRWRINLVTRRALRAMPDERLADIGLERAAAEAESRRPFWR